jgi:rare lipoprotein A
MRLAIISGVVATPLLTIAIFGNGIHAEPRARHAAAPSIRCEATAFSQSGITMKGTIAHDGIVAADPAVIPLGSVIRVAGAGPWSGRYVVTDTGSKVRGRHIDVYLPNAAAAKQFGRKTVTVQVLVRGNNVKNDRKEVTPARPGAAVPPSPVVTRK